MCVTPPPPPVWLICTLTKFSMDSEQVFVRPLRLHSDLLKLAVVCSSLRCQMTAGEFSGLRGCECVIA